MRFRRARHVWCCVCHAYVIHSTRVTVGVGASRCCALVGLGASTRMHERRAVCLGSEFPRALCVLHCLDLHACVLDHSDTPASSEASMHTR